MGLIMITVQGVLTTPTNKPVPRAKITITAQNHLNQTLAGMPATEMTGSDGSYEFPLLEGDFLIEVLVEGEDLRSGQVRIDENVGSPIELPALLNEAKLE